MKIPGLQWIKNVEREAERKGNEAELPMTDHLGLVDFVKLTYKEVDEDHVMAFAGNLTYKALFAIFPFFTFLLSLLGIFDATNLVDHMVGYLEGVAGQSATEFIGQQLDRIASSQAEGAFTVGAILSVGLALWGISGAFRSIMEAMNVMYGVEESRTVWKVYGISVFISLAVIVLMLAAFGIVVVGRTVGGGLAGAIGLGPVFNAVWTIVQWPIVACVVLFTFSIIYFFAPAARQRFRWISPGAILAFVFWLVFSLIFSFYVGNVGSYDAAYGSLAGAIILMLYIYYSAVIMLVGAEMNQVIEWHIPGGKNEGDRVPEDDRKPDVQRLSRDTDAAQREQR